MIWKVTLWKMSLAIDPTQPQTLVEWGNTKYDSTNP